VLAGMVAKVRGGQGIHVICNGGDLEEQGDSGAVVALRTRLGLDGKTVLGFVGFVRPWHGLEWAIRALPRLPGEVHLLVVGDGPAQEGLENEAAALGVRDRVHSPVAFPMRRFRPMSAISMWPCSPVPSAMPRP
jgi:glycosyltransferase involved in cell wall biosynthesis